MYLVRDVLTGRVLCAENVSSSERESMRTAFGPRRCLKPPHSRSDERCPAFRTMSRCPTLA